MAAGALLVDTRPLDQRVADGEVPGAVVVGREHAGVALRTRRARWRMPEADPAPIGGAPLRPGCVHRVLAVDRLLEVSETATPGPTSSASFQAGERRASRSLRSTGSCLDRPAGRGRRTATGSMSGLRSIRRRAVVAQAPLYPRLPYGEPDPALFDKIVNLCKRRGFVFPSAEIYGGFRSTYDYGPLGVLLLRNVKDAWWRSMVQLRDDVVGLDAAILVATPGVGGVRAPRQLHRPARRLHATATTGSASTSSTTPTRAPTAARRAPSPRPASST